jgi:hypothetical protein
MKTILLFFLLASSQAFAADDPSVAALGEWSKPVAIEDGFAIRGRLLICDTPDHASSVSKTDTAVYLELQEFSAGVSSVRVHCELSGRNGRNNAPGLRFELRDAKGKLVPHSPGGFGGGMPESCWLTLEPYGSARLRASVYGGGRLSDGGLAIYLASGGWWDVHPNPTNEYFLSATFTAKGVTNKMGWVEITNRNVWHGTLALPPVKIPVQKK